MPTLEELLAACREDEYEKVFEWLTEDPQLAHARTMLGSQAIHAAHFAGRERVVKLILSRGVSMNVFLASELGNTKYVQDEISKEPHLATAFNESGATALHSASYWGQIATARMLLDHGADANAPTRDSFLEIMPLGCAVATPDTPNPSDREEIVLNLVALLLRHGAKVNGRRRDGLTALHSAAHRGHYRVIELLLEHGADASIQGTDGPHAGHSASDVAISQGHRKVAELLESHG